MLDLCFQLVLRQGFGDTSFIFSIHSRWIETLSWDIRIRRRMHKPSVENGFSVRLGTHHLISRVGVGSWGKGGFFFRPLTEVDFFSSQGRIFFLNFQFFFFGSRGKDEFCFSLPDEAQFCFFALLVRGNVFFFHKTSYPLEIYGALLNVCCTERGYTQEDTLTDHSCYLLLYARKTHNWRLMDPITYTNGTTISF